MNKRLTLTDHERIGAELFEIRNRLLTLGGEIANTHPKASSVGRNALKMASSVDRVRAHLDNEAIAAGGSTRTYYPGTGKQGIAK